MGQELGATSSSREVCPRTPPVVQEGWSSLHPPTPLLEGPWGAGGSSALILKLRRRAAGLQKTPSSSRQRGEPSPEGKLWEGRRNSHLGKCLGTAPGGLSFHHGQDRGLEGSGLAAPKLVSTAERIRAGELQLLRGSGTPWQRRLRDIGPLSRY